ncbi:U4/U6.U5 tri-snRNP-associated protein 1 [Cydia fagiglandana]|uniref:U4/U6.U5 tri-snRNP-associated protein 1 n=1 Tax=Cydia fagiglandana TaxID=1458189 RepID=UPI002FEE04B0
MGSKKHKKESKKKKHRSRSRSPLEGEERERKRHRKHKDRKKDRSPDVEEVPVDSHLTDRYEPGFESSPSSNGERERERSLRRERVRDEPVSTREVSYPRDSYSRESSPRAGGSAAEGAGAGESLSIEDTNRLRAKLGLKPLEVQEKPDDDGKFKDDLGEFYHKPAANLAQQRRTEKIRERLELRKEKRQMEMKLQTTLLAEGSDEEDASAWVNKSRDIEKQKQEAAKRAAMLDEMDAVFGVSALVEEEERADRSLAYSASALTGLRVAHDLNSLADERDTVLTLADKDVLAEDAEDVLVNVNIVDDERYKKNIESRKKAKTGYQAYDDEADLEAAALGYQKPVLSKYDEELDKEAAEKRRGFVLGDHAGIEAQRFRDMMRQERMRGGPDKRLETLKLPELKLASDYLSEAELNAKFKKTKRRGKIRKKAKEEPIDVDDYDAAAAPLETDDTDVKVEQLKTSLVIDEEEVEVDSELQTALARARRLRQAEHTPIVPKVEEILEKVKEEPEGEEPTDGVMVLDACAEFCRTLGDIPTYGQAGNRDHTQEIMDFEREEADPEPSGAEGSGAWSRVDLAEEAPADLLAGGAALAAEPALGHGVAGALQLALSKGYLERAGPQPAPRAALTHLLQARHYTIEDKTQGDDDKHGRRERGGGGGGPLTEFREKSSFRPRIKLEYADDDGRPLAPKEAFRYLSHKFHGKGPGKNKQEKRIKKQLQEGLMKKMSSTDTPLGTLQMLQDKQKETKSAYVVLSGAKRDPPR